MSSGRGRARVEYIKPLRKPGESVENEEKPAIDQPVVLGESGIQSQLQSMEISITTEQRSEETVNNIGNTAETAAKEPDPVLVKALHTSAEFIPKLSQGVGGAQAMATPSKLFATAAYAREFVPGQPFYTQENTPAKKMLAIRNFVNTKITQVQQDPGLMDEISVSMANYLSSSIATDDDLKLVSVVLFEKCISEQNFQYIGTRLANYLDKHLIVPKGLLSFRSAFLARCSDTYSQLGEMILNQPQQVPSLAMFFGELLMNYKAIDGKPIAKFRDVVSNTIKSLLESPHAKLHICAGKLLKLTGGSLDQNNDIFLTVQAMASHPNTDKTAKILFNRVCDLKKTMWHGHVTAAVEVPPEMSLYIPSVASYLEEAVYDAPVRGQEEWGDYVVDETQDEEDDQESLFRQLHVEQYGYAYTPYTTNAGDANDDYDADYEQFLSQGYTR